MYTLRKIIEEYYYELASAERLKLLQHLDDEVDDTTKKNNFYQDKVKNFNKIIHVMDLRDEMEQLKGLSSNNYSFDNEGRRFVLMLLREFAGKLDPLRRGEIFKADSEFILELYRGFLNIFKTAGASQELLEKVSQKMYNRLDVPVRIVQSAREASSKRLEEMIIKKMSGVTLGMNTLEKYEWLIGLRQDLDAVIMKWEELYSIMGELRTMEINNIAEEKAYQMSAEETYEAKLDFAFSGEYLKAEKNDAEYRELLKKKCKLLGIPLEEELLRYEDYNIIKKNQKIFKHKKRKFVKDIEYEFNDVNAKLAIRSMKLRTQVIKSHIPEYEPAEIVEDDFDYSILCSAEELLAKAVEEQKEEWKCDEERNKCSHIELPEKSLEEIYRELDDLLPIGTRAHFYPNIEE